MNTLEDFNRSQREDCALDCSALRCENALMRYYGAVQPGKAGRPVNPDSLQFRVENYFNGHPVGLDELCVQFPECKRDRLGRLCEALRARGRLKRVGCATYQRSNL